MPGLKLLRVLGPPGSGKTLLITALVEEFRSLGEFVATSAPRGDVAGAAATVITTSSGARVTVERALLADELCRLVASLDPRASLLLAESLDAPGHPAVELVPPGTKPSTPRADLLAPVAPSEAAPGAVAPLAALVQARLLRGDSPGRDLRSLRGLLGRLFN